MFSFVPIPGAQQHKRPRRRYEEIERMYKCGWNGCEKAYGTLNHLNAHVTMQSHGQKRVPEGKYLNPMYSNVEIAVTSTLALGHSLVVVCLGCSSLRNTCDDKHIWSLNVFTGLTELFFFCRVQGNSQGVEGTEEG